MDRPQKITFGEMRQAGVRGVLVYCSDFRCSHSTPISGDRWPDDVRLSDLEPRFIREACGRRGADVRPNFPLGARGKWNPNPPIGDCTNTGTNRRERA